MATTTLQDFRERVGRKALTPDIKIVYRISGGVGDRHVNEEYKIEGRGQAQMRLRTGLRPEESPEEGAAILSEAQVHSLFERIEQGLTTLVPREQARFEPDSLVGSVTIEVNGETETLYFLADEAQRRRQNKPVAPAIIEVAEILRSLLRKFR